MVLYKAHILVSVYCNYRTMPALACIPARWISTSLYNASERHVCNGFPLSAQVLPGQAGLTGLVNAANCSLVNEDSPQFEIEECENEALEAAIR